jgi:hypothetical protein
MNESLNVNYMLILKKSRNFGMLNNTTFVLNTSKAFTGTANGFNIFIYIFKLIDIFIFFYIWKKMKKCIELIKFKIKI